MLCSDFSPLSLQTFETFETPPDVARYRVKAAAAVENVNATVAVVDQDQVHLKKNINLFPKFQFFLVSIP